MLCPEPGSSVMQRSADTDTFRSQMCGATTGITGMWDTAVRGSFGCKLFRACGSRRVHVSPVGSVMCFVASCDTGLKLSRRASCWGGPFTSVCATSLYPLAGGCTMLGVEKSFQDRIWQSAVNIVTCLFMKMQWKAVDEKFKVSMHVLFRGWSHR